jgi:hypothetical protein
MTSGRARDMRHLSYGSIPTFKARPTGNLAGTRCQQDEENRPHGASEFEFLIACARRFHIFVIRPRLSVLRAAADYADRQDQSCECGRILSLDARYEKAREEGAVRIQPA